MPIPVINYAALQPQGNQALRNLIPSLQQGFQAGLSPFLAMQEMDKNKFANEIAKIQAKYAPQMNQAELAYKQQQVPYMEAQTQLAQAMAQLPFGGKSLPGIGGEILALESVKKMFGENSVQYKQALDAFNLQQRSTGSRINYQDALAQTLPTRSLSPTGKLINEESNIEAGLTPSGTTPKHKLPGNTDQLKANYELVRQKNSTDEDTRKRNLYAANIEKTLNQINPDDLTQYSGVLGTANKYFQQALSGFGKESDNFDKYANALKAAELLSTQARQFYGESIQPEMIRRLEKLTNPSEWSNNPKLAKQLFNKTKNILEQEMQTYRDALQDTDVYKGQSNLTINPTPEQAQRLVDKGIATYGPKSEKYIEEKTVGDIEYGKKIDGEWYEK